MSLSEAELEAKLAALPEIDIAAFRLSMANSPLPERVRTELIAEMELRYALTQHLRQLIQRKLAGETMPLQAMLDRLNQVAEQHGHEHGLPVPHVGDGQTVHELVLADRAPLAMLQNFGQATEHAERLAQTWRGAVRNSWTVLGDHTVSVVQTEQGPMWMKEPMAGNRLRKVLADVGIRSDVPSLTAEAELAALESLKAKIKPNQYRTYVLSGSFIEWSPRSDLFYLFRKGRPTLVFSYHGENRDGGACIAALCGHIIGYYQFSHVGVCVPTDEVIAALLCMRGAEHRYWKNSGQYSASDPRSGV